MVRASLALVCSAVLSAPALLLGQAPRPSQNPPSPILALEEIDRLDLQVHDTESLVRRYQSQQSTIPFKNLRFAEPIETAVSPADIGTWERLANGLDLWRLRVRSRTALSLSIVFDPLRLPPDAHLWIYDPGASTVHGPFGASDRSSRGRFFSPLVPGSELVIELVVPHDQRAQVVLALTRVDHGFVSLAKEVPQKSHGACNNDVICPLGDPWRNQIRSVARYTIDGMILCTGQMVNNTAQDGRPLFLSAAHCDVTPLNEDTLVFYWNYQSPTCDAQSGGSLADFQMGATFLAENPSTDFVLVELQQRPDPAFDVFYAGWDVRGMAAQSSVSIHHPEGDEKSISFNDDPVVPIDFGVGGLTHWEVDAWEDVTTEGGSSGACLFDRNTGLCIGVLTGGFASCTTIAPDYYGRLDLSWDGPSPALRLRDWLDPLGIGAQLLPGLNQSGAVEIPAASSWSLLALGLLLGIIGWLHVSRA